MEPVERRSVGLEQARDVLRQEKAASAPPGQRTPEPDYGHLIPRCQCADCRRTRGEPVEPFDDFGIEGEDDVGLELPPDMPPQMVEELLDAAAEAARRGESFDSFASRVLGGRSPGRRRQARRKKRTQR